MKIARHRFQLAVLTRRLADLTSGGMNLSRSLEILSDRTQNSALRRMLHELKNDLESGKSFYQALSIQNGFFPPVFIGLVRAGESSGTLEKSLEELASLLESEIEARQRLRAAISYPLFLLALAAGVSLFLTTFVIPRFQFLFQDLGQRLPLPTRLLIIFSIGLKKGGWILIALVIALVIWTSKRNGKRRMDAQKFLLRIPWVSGMIQNLALQRWSQVMASLLRSGLTIVDALHLSRHSVGNPVYADEIRSVLKNVMEGRSLAQALKASPLFPPMISELVMAGEESSQLDQTFTRLSTSLRRETEVQWKLMLSFLEPTLILGMGVVVGFVALAMLLPIFEMSASFR